MSNDSCTVILNGHGVYSSQYIINVQQYDYNIIFPCKLKQLVSVPHHNLLLSSFCTNIATTHQLLEKLPTTCIASKTQTSALASKTIDMFDTKNILIYDHALINSPDVKDAQTLYDIDKSRFKSSDLIHERKGWKGTIHFEYDLNQVKKDVTGAYSSHKTPPQILHLSKENLIYLSPTTVPDKTISFQLSDLIADILPKVKIPLFYDNGSISNAPPFLDDGFSELEKGQMFQSILGSNYAPRGSYHEMTIAGDANIIWDACREHE